MVLKNFWKNYKTEVVMLAFALFAGVISFFVTLSINSDNVANRGVASNLEDNVKNKGTIAVYIDDEPTLEYEESGEKMYRAYRTNEERQINENTNVDERVVWQEDVETSEVNGDSEIADDYILETESESLEMNLPVSENVTAESAENTVVWAENVEEKNNVISFDYPISGEIIFEFAKEKLVFSETLEEWVTHDGIDIKAELAEPVKAAADGVVLSKKMDPRYGNTIIISHSNGYKTVYSNLSTLDMIEVGDEIKKGKIISGVGEGFGFEVKEGPHVHFEVRVNGQTKNPLSYI